MPSMRRSPPTLPLAGSLRRPCAQRPSTPLPSCATPTLRPACCRRRRSRRRSRRTRNNFLCAHGRTSSKVQLGPHLEMMFDIGMQEIPATGVSRLGRLTASLATAAHNWGLFIDIDGTLLDMASSPDAVVVPPDLVETLGQLKRHFGGAVALVTGRRIIDADRFFAPLKLMGVGVHG